MSAITISGSRLLTPYDFTAEQWQHVLDMYRSGYAAGETDGWNRGYERGWWAGSRDWATKQPPAVSTPYIQGLRPRPPEREYKTPAQTPQQIRAQAEYSWRKRRREISVDSMPQQQGGRSA